MTYTYPLVALMVALTLAGCFGDKAAPAEDDGLGADAENAPFVPPVPEFDFSTALEVVHVADRSGHENPLLHQQGFGMEPKAFTDLTAGARYQGLINGQYNEVDVCGDWAAVASFAGNRGFTLVNITDTSAPRVAAQYATASTNWDVRFSPNCELVFVGMELGALEPGTLEVPAQQVAGVHDAGRGGVLVVDVSTPSALVRESYNEVGSVHNLFSADVGGETYVITNTGVISKLVGEPGSRSLETVATIPRSHDVHVMPHPVTGHPYLFTGSDGLSIYDFADPAAPEMIANLELPPGHTMGHEQTPAPSMIDGRWILMGAGECQCGLPDPYSIADITDPSEPVYLGSWMMPGDFSDHNEATAFYTFSSHNIAIREDGRVALANYHAGTWVIDISTQERQTNPVTLAFHLPAQFNMSPPPGGVENSAAMQRSLPYSPFVWGGAFAHDGTLLVADLNTGLYLYDIE